jgi:hypothetical protein
MRFSQRIGVKPATKLAQRESMDDELRASLWSLITICFWEKAQVSGGERLRYSDQVRYSTVDDLMVQLWFHHFKLPTDTIDEYWGNCLARLRKYFFDAEWDTAYDFVEFLAQRGSERLTESFIQLCNRTFETENSAYRFVGSTLTEITSQAEIEAVESAIQEATSFAGVRQHLQTGLSLMSDRKTPDFRNSIKESVSAVESLAKHITKDQSASFGSVLKELERTAVLHPALRNAFSSLYGYTSDAQGIRHALLDEPTLTKADAQFMLVCCSAFVNFVIQSTGRK